MVSRTHQACSFCSSKEPRLGPRCCFLVYLPKSTTENETWMSNESGEDEILHFIWHFMSAFEHYMWLFHWCSQWKPVRFWLWKWRSARWCNFTSRFYNGQLPHWIPDFIVIVTFWTWTEFKLLHHLPNCWVNRNSLLNLISVHDAVSQMFPITPYQPLKSHEVFTAHFCLFLWIRNENWSLCVRSVERLFAHEQKWKTFLPLD